MNKIRFQKGKRGISVIIGYVLLIAVVISISVLVYSWLKSYVPTDVLTCPDGVSISIPSYTYNCTSHILNFSLENIGTFSIAGYFIHATNSPNQTLATIDLSTYHNGTGTIYLGAILYSNYASGVNSIIPPGSSGLNTIPEGSNEFTIPASFGNLTTIEVTPVRYVQYKGQTRFASCGDAKITQTLSCS